MVTLAEKRIIRRINLDCLILKLSEGKVDKINRKKRIVFRIEIGRKMSDCSDICATPSRAMLKGVKTLQLRIMRAMLYVEAESNSSSTVMHKYCTKYYVFIVLKFIYVFFYVSSMYGLRELWQIVVLVLMCKVRAG